MIRQIYLGIICILLLHLPFLLLGEDSYIRIHDNLDSEHLYLHILKMYGMLFGKEPSTINAIMNGLHRDYIHSEFSFIRVLYYTFPSFWAYVINSIIVRLIGFTSMLLLIRDYLVKDDNSIVLCFLSLAFATLPIYGIYGLTVMGQPLTLWAFLNLIHKRHLAVSFFILCFIPFYSHIALFGVFGVAVAVVYGLYTIRRNSNIYYWMGVFIFSFFLLLANFHMVFNHLFSDELSQRSSWDISRILVSVFKATTRSAFTMFFGQHHYARLFGVPILIAFIVYLSRKWKEIDRKILGVAVMLGFISLYYGFYTIIISFLERSLGISTQFQVSRFVCFIPILYTILAALLYASKHVSAKIMQITIVCFFLSSLFLNTEFLFNTARTVGIKDGLELYPFSQDRNPLSYTEYYSQSLFKKIDRYINKEKESYRVVSIGIHPGVSQYNGFYSLDSYQNNYPLKYKEEFRQIIEPELRKSTALKAYFDGWGSKCYLFSSELFEVCQVCTKDHFIEINHLSLNTNKLKEMGAEYVFSAVKINNAVELGFNFEKIFEDDKSPYCIYLYNLY